MTTRIFTLAILILTITSCNNNHTQDKPKQEIPKALEDKSSSNDFLSKRSQGYGDLVENLYNELVSKNVDLKKLEDKIDDLDESKNDTTNMFAKFNEKNQAYFSSVDSHILEIKDSLLRDKMKVLIANNLEKYNTSIVRHNELLKIMEGKHLTISDLHNILKIVKTLPLIEKYQKDYLPSTKSFEGYIKQQEETIKVIDTLTKR